MRRAVIERNTNETRIKVSLNLDGMGRFENQSGIRFLDHMLDLVARHGGFDLKVRAAGDLDVDQHHTVEDIGITLGETVSRMADLISARESELREALAQKEVLVREIHPRG